MKTIFSLSLILFFKVFCVAQNDLNLVLYGALTSSDQQTITYKVVITKIDEDKIVGYSITDYKGANFTRSTIEGTLNRKKKTLSFKEISNVNTKSNAEAATFCYISVENLKYKYVKETTVVGGKFLGVFPSGESCAEGIVYLIGDGSFEIKETEVKKVVEEEIIIKEEPVQAIGSPKDTVLRSNQTLVIETLHDGAILEVWDGNVEDNDMIDIYLDGEIFQDKILLKRKKKIIELPAEKDSYTLKIVALNEGFSGVNTVNFTLKNVTEEKEYISELTKGESFEISFKRKGE